MLNERMMIRNPDLNVMHLAITKAARRMVRDFGEVEHLQVSRKGPGNFVTMADKRSEKSLVENLSKARPNIGFLLEESGEITVKNAEGRWIIDPLDGTTNFIHAIPHFCISVALEVKGEIVAGMIHDPISDEFYYAAKGHGAYVNERRLRVSARHEISDALIVTCPPHKKDSQVFHDYYKKLILIDQSCAAIRRMGSAALGLCMVAMGKADAFIAADLEPWDTAAASLIIQESGGFISRKKGNQDFLIAGNETMHNDLEKLIKA